MSDTLGSLFPNSGCQSWRHGGSGCDEPDRVSRSDVSAPTARSGGHSIRLEDQKLAQAGNIAGPFANPSLAVPLHAAYMLLMKRFIPFIKSAPRVAVVQLQGIIASGARGAALSDKGLAPQIEKAFSRGKPVAVALLINSPGGSPSQSSLIAARIRRLAAEKKVPVYAFVEDVAASGGYWLATAADEIWVDENSIVGSIGVISAGFGFNEFMERHGVERRIYTAGKSKSLGDPFQPEKAADVKRIKDIQQKIHANFIAQVKARRGGKLADRDLFTGEIWVGASAVDDGLVDGVGHLVPKMKETFGDKVRFALYSQKRPLLGRLGARVIDDLTYSIEERASFARFGL